MGETGAQRDFPHGDIRACLEHARQRPIEAVFGTGAANGWSSTEAGGAPVVAVAGEVRYGSRGVAKALTCGGGGPYHGEMNMGRDRGKLMRAGAWLVVAMSLAGCEDAAKRPVQAHAPGLQPSQVNGAQVQGQQE